MIHENPEKNALYTIFEGEIGELAEKVTGFCRSEYGDKCEFYTVSIERHHPRGGSWQVHEFQSFENRAVRAIENHLKARRDIVKLKFGDSSSDSSLELIICPARNTAQLARHVKKQHLEDVDEGALVVLSVSHDGEEADEESRDLIKSLDK